MKKTSNPVRTDWVPTPRLQRRLREVEAGRNLVHHKSFADFMACSREVYATAHKKQKV